jgi:hypothetical protein
MQRLSRGQAGEALHCLTVCAATEAARAKVASARRAIMLFEGDKESRSGFSMET